MDLEDLAKQADIEIPVDYFVSKRKRKKKKKDKDLFGNGNCGIGNLQFTDASGNFVFGVNNKLSKSNNHDSLLFDASGHPLISLRRNHVSSYYFI